MDNVDSSRFCFFRTFVLTPAFLDSTRVDELESAGFLLLLKILIFPAPFLGFEVCERFTCSGAFSECELSWERIKSLDAEKVVDCLFRLIFECRESELGDVRGNVFE